MGIEKKKTADMHKKYREEREKKALIAAAAIEALFFWKKTTADSERQIANLLKTLKAETLYKASIMEWLIDSPFKLFKLLGEKMRQRKGAGTHRQDVAAALSRKQKDFDKLRIEFILAGDKKLDIGQIAERIGTAKADVEAHLKEIAHERNTPLAKDKRS